MAFVVPWLLFLSLDPSKSKETSPQTLINKVFKRRKIKSLFSFSLNKSRKLLCMAGKEKYICPTHNHRNTNSFYALTSFDLVWDRKWLLNKRAGKKGGNWNVAVCCGFSFSNLMCSLNSPRCWCFLLFFFCLLGLLHRWRRGPETWFRAAAAGDGDGRLPSCHTQTVRLALKCSCVIFTFISSLPLLFCVTAEPLSLQSRIVALCDLIKDL